MKKFLALALIALAVLTMAAPASAARPNNRDATLVVNPSAAVVGDSVVLSGCGYAPGVEVTLTVTTPTADIWYYAPMADAAGCFTTAGTNGFFPSAAGVHAVETFQAPRYQKALASASFQVAP